MFAASSGRHSAAARRLNWDAAWKSSSAVPNMSTGETRSLRRPLYDMTSADMAASTEARISSRRPSASSSCVVSSDCLPAHSGRSTVGRAERAAAAAAAASVAEVSHEQLAPSAKAHAPARQYASPRETATAHPGSFLSEMFDSISAALVGAAPPPPPPASRPPSKRVPAPLHPSSYWSNALFSALARLRLVHAHAPPPPHRPPPPPPPPPVRSSPPPRRVRSPPPPRRLRSPPPPRFAPPPAPPPPWWSLDDVTPRLFAHPSNLAALVRNFSAWRAAAGALLAASLVVFVLAIASVVSRVASSWDSESSRYHGYRCGDRPPSSSRAGLRLDDEAGRDASPSEGVVKSETVEL
mmetsp:Transcript_34292/g.102567  ORF Transcript_34292/g.102567 Transcript_34292/m.102567 type:complete len:353 (+) Transcript_34292:754-1812(+)